MHAAGAYQVVRIAVGVVLVAALGACASGSSDVDVTTRTPVTSASGSPTKAQPSFGVRPWHDARRGEARDEVIVSFVAPDPASGGGCNESYRTETTVLDNADVVVMIKLSTPEAAATCPTTRRELSVKIDDLREGSVLQAGLTGSRYRLSGEHFDLLATSTPCGRVDCSTPAPKPAPCDFQTVHDAIARGIDGGIRVVGPEKCDGSFLIVNVDTGSGGCPPTEGGPSPCAKLKTAYFVANVGTWTIVSYGPDMTCNELEAMSSIRFPLELCA